MKLQSSDNFKGSLGVGQSPTSLKKEGPFMQNNSLIAQFNRIYNDYCSIYRNIAKHFGLSETVFWILYTLIDENKPITQSYLCGIIAAKADDKFRTEKNGVRRPYNS